MSAVPIHSIVIEAGLVERHYWRDLWRYRELFLLLAWRGVASGGLAAVLARPAEAAALSAPGVS